MDPVDRDDPGPCWFQGRHDTEETFSDPPRTLSVKHVGEKLLFVGQEPLANQK